MNPEKIAHSIPGETRGVPGPELPAALRSGRGPRVLMIAPQPFFQLRGTPLNVLQMVRALCGAGYRVDLATYGLGEPVHVPGLAIHRAWRPPGIRGVPIGFSRRKILLDAALSALVARLLLTRRYDVVHAVEESIFFALPLARLRRIPLIYDLDSVLSDQLAYSGGIRAPRTLRGVRALEAWALRNSDLALTVCEALTEHVRRTAAVPVVQIEDAPLESSMRPPDAEATAALRRDLGLGDAPTAVYTGNLEGYQGVDLLLETLPTLAALCPDARLVIVGGEPPQIAAASASLRVSGLEKTVVFAGKQPPERMSEYMGLADALVSPRRSGANTPLKIYTYMYSGVPIVATDLPTHTQVLDRQSALLCPPTPEGLGSGIAEVLNDPQRFAPLAARARERVQRDFSPAAFRRKLLAAYETLLAGRFTADASSM